MIEKIVVVCVGNICRSPLGERLLKNACPNLAISSAGIGALVGNVADETATTVAQSHGISLAGHAARQFTVEIGADADLILVMEKGHKAQIVRDMPQLSGKVMLFDHWQGGKGIADPYKKSPEFHEAVFQQVEAATKGWSERLTRNSSV